MYFYLHKFVIRFVERSQLTKFLITIFHHTHTQVTATDGDKDRPQNIVYFLTGQGIDPDNPANSKFDINRTTGEIFVLKVSLTIAIARYTLPPLLPSAHSSTNWVKWKQFSWLHFARQNVLNHIDLCEYPGANRIGKRKILFFFIRLHLWLRSEEFMCGWEETKLK